MLLLGLAIISELKNEQYRAYDLLDLDRYWSLVLSFNHGLQV
jgi:hypothetical protein